MKIYNINCIVYYTRAAAFSCVVARAQQSVRRKENIIMSYNDTSKKATMKYINNNLDTVSFRLPKEKKDDRPTKEELKAHCEKYGYNGIQPFILSAIQKQMLLDKREAAFIDFNECKLEE